MPQVKINHDDICKADKNLLLTISFVFSGLLTRNATACPKTQGHHLSHYKSSVAWSALLEQKHIF